MDHIWITYGSHMDHIWIIYGSYMDHMGLRPRAPNSELGHSLMAQV